MDLHWILIFKSPQCSSVKLKTSQVVFIFWSAVFKILLEFIACTIHCTERLSMSELQDIDINKLNSNVL